MAQLSLGLHSCWLDSWVMEADHIKLLREGESTGFRDSSISGSKPRALRKRAFWRALKRGELWLIKPTGKELDPKSFGSGEKYARVIESPHCQNDRYYISWPMESFDL